MTSNKTELINRQKLTSLINSLSIKHIWLANKVGVSEKTLTRWINGDVTRIRIRNLQKLAGILDCDMADLIATSEIDIYSSTKNRDTLINELYNDSLLYELLVGSKIKLAISLIKSTFHSQLPSAILASFYIKLGYAALLHRKQKTAFKYFSKASVKAQSAKQPELSFSINLAFAITYFFDCQYEQCLNYLSQCEATKEFAGPERAHFYSTFALYYLFTGQFDSAIISAKNCIAECAPGKESIEKKLFLCTALQLKGASHLFKGEIAETQDCCTKALAVAHQSGYTRCVDVSKAYLAACYAFQGQLDSALTLSTQSIQSINEKDISVPSLLCIAIYVHRKTGDEHTSRQLFEQLAKKCKERSAPRVFSQYQMALIEQLNGEQDKATKLYQQVIESLYELGLTHWIKFVPKQNYNQSDLIKRPSV